LIGESNKFISLFEGACENFGIGLAVAWIASCTHFVVCVVFLGGDDGLKRGYGEKTEAVVGLEGESSKLILLVVCNAVVSRVFFVGDTIKLVLLFVRVGEYVVLPVCGGLGGVLLTCLVFCVVFLGCVFGEGEFVAKVVCFGADVLMFTLPISGSIVMPFIGLVVVCALVAIV